MKIEVSIDELRKKSLFIGSPMYGGMCSGLYAKSCLDLNNICNQYGIEVKFSYLMNESLIPRARNYITDEFLNRTNCTHMMFIDADIAFNAQDVIALLALNKDILGGLYPKKSLEWGQLHKAIQKNPALPASEYSTLTGGMVFNPIVGTQKFSVTEPLEIMDLGTGFMMIERSVFERFMKAYPEKMYKPDHVGQAHFSGDREICAFFDCVIDPDSKRYLSEDYYFTQQCRKIGISSWACPWMKLSHVGTHIFSGDLPAVAAHLGEI